jgi:uncharacterized RDD family membrane protein YckC
MDQLPQTDILEDVQQEIHLVPVSPGIRFANFIIDLIVYYALTFGAGMIWAVIAYSNSGYDAGGSTEPVMGFGIKYLIAYSVYIIYYTLIEGVSKGRSLGKLATGTIAVKEDGSAITFKDALLRTLCRIIPFEPFSAFGYRPWHDSFTNTIVIKKQR